MMNTTNKKSEERKEPFNPVDSGQNEGKSHQLGDATASLSDEELDSVVGGFGSMTTTLPGVGLPNPGE